MVETSEPCISLTMTMIAPLRPSDTLRSSAAMLLRKLFERARSWRADSSSSMCLCLTGMCHAKSCRAVPGGSSLNSLFLLANAKPLTSDGIPPTSIGQARPQPLLRLSSHLASLGQPPSLPLVNPIFILASSSLLLANLSPLSARPLAVFHTSLGHAASLDCARPF